MNREQIIKIAKKANKYASKQTGRSYEWQRIRDEQFANLVAEIERDACAKVCDKLGDAYADANAADCAEAIRSRGKE